MDSSRLCLEIMWVWRGGWLLCLALPQRAVGDLAYDSAAFCIDSASVGFAILPRISTSWLHFPWDWRPTAEEPQYRSLIPWLHHVPSNLSRLFEWELHVQAARSLALESDAKIRVPFCWYFWSPVVDRQHLGSGRDLCYVPCKSWHIQQNTDPPVISQPAWHHESTLQYHCICKGGGHQWRSPCYSLWPFEWCWWLLSGIGESRTGWSPKCCNFVSLWRMFAWTCQQRDKGIL